MFCAACGSENVANAPFCVSCGAGLTVLCAHCQAQLPSGARFCPSCGRPAKSDAPHKKAASSDTTHFTAGERKQVTVLFADFAGFTAFVHKQDVEDVRDYLTSVWSRLDKIIASYGGRTEKHIGDAVMAIFGADQACEDDPVRAVRAALAMQACLSEWRPKGTQPRLEMRMGVHTGLVVLGPVARSGEVTAIGDAVNLANRLEQNAPLGSVLISHDTYRLVYGFFDVQPLPPLTVKGRPEPVETYLVLKAKPRALAVQLRGVEGVQTHMVGRQLELKRLQSEFEQVVAGHGPRVVTIVGEAGIGKSCLLNEFQHWIELLPQNVRLFWGRGRPETTGLPFSLLRDMFAARFEIQESDPPAQAREKLQRGLLDLLSSGKGADVPPAAEPHLEAQFIPQLLGFDCSDSVFLKDILQDPEQIRQRAFHYLSRFFQVVSHVPSGLNALSPVSAALLLAEDVHWSDDGSLDLIEFLARTCHNAPLFIVCLTRPTLFERRPAWGQDLPGHVKLELGPLSRQESRSLVAAILAKAPEIPQALRELVVGGAEGIPFYIEEIVKMLIDQKVIVVGPEQWRIEPNLLAAARVPGTLTGILQARLDGLTPSERTVLQCASVIGRVFWDSAVERLASSSKPPAEGAGKGILSRDEVRGALTALRHKEIIFRRESSAFAGAVEYRFKHELLRNVTYEGLLKKARRNHHARAASWLIEQSGERVKEFAGVVALHFEQGGWQAEAAEWFGRAGQQARRGYTPALAIDYFRKALELLPAAQTAEADLQAKQWEYYEGLGEVLGAQARFAEGLEAYGKACQFAEALGDFRRQAQALNGLAFLQERLGKNRASIDCAEHAEVLAHKAGPAARRELIKALHLKGWAFYRLGDAAAVLALGDQTLKLCTDFNERPGLATTYKLYGVAHLQLGHFAEADRYFQQGLALCQQSGDRRNTAAMFNNLGESARARGDYQAAADLYEEALGIAREIGHRESEMIYLTNLSGARLGLQQFSQAETDLRRAIALTASPNSCALAETYTFLGEACLRQGKLAEALDAARLSLALAREAENDLYLGGVWRSLGMIVAAFKDTRVPEIAGLPQPLEVRACFAESLRVFKKIHAEGEQARTLQAWAEFELQQCRSEEGRRKGQAARSLFLRLGATAEVVRIDALLALQTRDTLPSGPLTNLAAPRPSM